MADVGTVEVRYFAGAADAAGTDLESYQLRSGATVADVKGALRERHGTALDRVLSVAVFLIGDEMVRDDAYPVGHRVDVLPPFAGG
ncbi:molybdopterin synthase sulfur carrier subunit [Rhodococcus sp. Leaf7]|uniref:MoaD/ThiS family protein n=1 Tax=unclassified Rhodococcus (in: high G+C Gram-positive bacteria) TaxID=192944 RepID=UPI0006F80FDB|nr:MULTISPECIES: MoaD/ThiS family protein [unclassified Rhodococcus (in: high G+C Gram-positive bacteria)]KQU02682.1 molybdopterin synthase sulfur carrier subunit [Rhodococcus sp. Leaf7]KQU38154.1 molybdopterin synthase sulfur carrier subunit [Rhodococcus sp. Leaf247]